MTKPLRIFITGTDTDVGKTFISCCLLELFQRKKATVSAVKPVAAGCEFSDGQLVNQDALLLQQSMQYPTDYQTVNPIALEPAIAPHIAAQEIGLEISVKSLQQVCNLAQYTTDLLLVEGAGGWLVPLNASETLADFAAAESLDVVLVIEIKLGCISHALLTIQSIRSKGLRLVGWVANKVDRDMPVVHQNIQTLKEAIDAPLLGQVPLLGADKTIQQACEYVNIAPLFA
jgi:dethiobiotin synthetase